MSTGHTVTIRKGDAHVEVHLGGELLAKSDRPLLLDETGLPTRYYLPRDDVRMDLLSRSLVRTGCAYKGYAEHFDLGSVPAVAWSYREPRPEVSLVRDLVCFYQERPEVALEIDGEVRAWPPTPWSRVDWISRYLGSSADSAGGPETTDP